MSMMIKNHALEIPIIQGGMGVAISLGGLAGAVAACGAMGTVSAAIPGFQEPDYLKSPRAANRRALARELRRAREISGGRGLIAVNAMVATTGYAESVQTAIAAGADAIVSGAGLPLELPALAAGTDAALAPIVSSGRAAATICKLWEKRYGVLPDFVVVEGAKAGGHLGFSKEEIFNGRAKPLEALVAEVVSALAPFGGKRGGPIPVFAAGGVWSGGDAVRMAQNGAAGVQLATRFIASFECDGSQAYKDILLAARKEDVRIVSSPVGMPGRALNTPLIQRLEAGNRFPSARCTDCLVPCPHAATPYCILTALTEARRGNYEEGLFFCGSNVWRLDKMRTVREILNEIMEEWRALA